MRVRALCRLALVVRTSAKGVPDMDRLDDEDLVLDVDLALRL